MATTLKRLVRAVGKRAFTFVMGKLNVAKMANFMEVDVFVLVASPENSLIDTRVRTANRPSLGVISRTLSSCQTRPTGLYQARGDAVGRVGRACWVRVSDAVGQALLFVARTLTPWLFVPIGCTDWLHRRLGCRDGLGAGNELVTDFRELQAALRTAADAAEAAAASGAAPEDAPEYSFVSGTFRPTPSSRAGAPASTSGAAADGDGIGAVRDAATSVTAYTARTVLANPSARAAARTGDS